MKGLFITLILLLLSAVGFSHKGSFLPTPAQEPDTTSVASSSLYMVSKVIDGDTIIVEMEGQSETVRLLGIDTPEVDPQYNPIECYGRQATTATKDKVLDQTVSLETDTTQGKRDKFDRILAYVFLADGTNLNEYLVVEGFAKEYTYNKAYKYQTAFKQSEQEARNLQKGLWSTENCPTAD
jgi:micrococcal nuclease